MLRVNASCVWAPPEIFLTLPLDVANDAEPVKVHVEAGKDDRIRRHTGPMSSNGQDGYHPPLALDDIMHRLSPSPAPAPDPTPTPSPHSTHTEGLEGIASQEIASGHVATSAIDTPVSSVISSSRPLETLQQDSSSQADKHSLGHRLEPSESEPELLSPSDAQSIRSRLGELGHGPGLSSSTPVPPRESELAAMVRILQREHSSDRLTSSIGPTSASSLQLHFRKGPKLTASRAS